MSSEKPTGGAPTAAPEAAPAPVAETAPAAKSAPVADPAPAPIAEVAPAPAAKPAPAPKTESAPAPAAKPAPATEPAPAAKVEAAPVAKVEAAPAAKVEAAPEAKVEAAPAAKVEAAPAAKVEAAPAAKVEAAPAAKVEAAPAAKVEAAPEAKVEAAPAAKVEAAPVSLPPPVSARAPMSVRAPAPAPDAHGAHGEHGGHGAPSSSMQWTLALAALGVVFGDIGTSPLYAVKECFSPESTHHVAPTPENVLGVLSLVFWSMMMVVTVKYLTFIMRADNQGSGGILALLALVPTAKPTDGRSGPAAGPGILVLLVLFGAALLYGDGVITPAISVLSAIEGLEVGGSEATKETLKHVILPLTCAVLLVLFLGQKHGTARVGAIFGPVTLVWFVAISALGLRQLIAYPAVFEAVDPRHAVMFFVHNKGHGFLILGSVVLCITGGEALYADMGHFGRGPIRRAWFMVVWPSLLLNYFGQGAALLMNPSAASNPFYAIVPEWALYPTVAIATAATVVASQALISGAFSLTQQAVQLGFFPRVTIIHTSKDTEGQIYIPEVNRALLVACIWLVLTFKSSTALAAAYGIAVTGTMGITTVVYYVVITRRWGWSKWKAVPLVGLFLFFDIAFFGANAAKFFDGGWFPIAMGVVLFTVMTTWKAGRRSLGEAIRASILPLQAFLDDVKEVNPHRVKGTAVFMASNPDGTPPVLLHHFKHNQVLHKKVVLLSIEAVRVPEVPLDQRVTLTPLGDGFFQVIAHYGFMQQPNVPQILALAAKQGLATEPGSTSYYLGRETLLTTGRSGMWTWRKTLFAFVSRNARPATAYFGLPPNRVVELGMQVAL